MLTTELDEFNIDLIKMLEPEVVPLTPEKLQELQVKAYERHLRHLEYNKKMESEKQRILYFGTFKNVCLIS